MLKILWRLILRLFDFKKGAKVPQGLEVLNSDGIVTLDATTETSFFIGSDFVTPSKKTITLKSDVFLTKNPFFIVVPRPDTDGDIDLRGYPEFDGINESLTGSTYSLTFSDVRVSKLNIIIGAY